RASPISSSARAVSTPCPVRWKNPMSWVTSRSRSSSAGSPASSAARSMIGSVVSANVKGTFRKGSGGDGLHCRSRGGGAGCAGLKRRTPLGAQLHRGALDQIGGDQLGDDPLMLRMVAVDREVVLGVEPGHQRHVGVALGDPGVGRAAVFT